MESLQGALVGYKEALHKCFNTGFEEGVRVKMRSTWAHAPTFDWELLGTDTVRMVEEFKEEGTAEATKLQAVGAKKNPPKKLISTKGVIIDPQLWPPAAMENILANAVETTPADLVETTPEDAAKVTSSTEVMNTELIEKTPSSDATLDPQAS